VILLVNSRCPSVSESTHLFLITVNWTVYIHYISELMLGIVNEGYRVWFGTQSLSVDFEHC